MPEIGDDSASILAHYGIIMILYSPDRATYFVTRIHLFLYSCGMKLNDINGCSFAIFALRLFFLPGTCWPFQVWISMNTFEWFDFNTTHFFHPHDDVIKWKHFPRNWPFVRRIHRSPVNSPHKGKWRGALMFSLICVWINDWVNNREAGDLRRYRGHYDVIVMPLVSGWSYSETTS